MSRNSVVEVAIVTLLHAQFLSKSKLVINVVDGNSGRFDSLMIGCSRYFLNPNFGVFI